MTPDEIKELKELIEFLKEYDIGEFEFERGDFKIRLKFGQPAQAPPASALDIARLGQLLSPAGHTPRRLSRKASTPWLLPGRPLLQTRRQLRSKKKNCTSSSRRSWARSTSRLLPAPPPLSRSGTQVENGQVLCIVEAMKLMNEIESDAAGEVVKRLVTNGQPVEYGQPLFALRLR